MWIYIPGAPSTSSASAPEAADWTAPSNWPSQTLARSCSWRGKLSPSLHWSRRLKAASWLRRLSGAMCEPSLAEGFAASWMASLAASRARSGPWPVAVPETPENATSGRRPGACSSNPVPGSSSSRTAAASSAPAKARCLGPSAYDETYADWVSRLRASSSARRTWASRTNGNGCSSSGSTTGWRTPTDDSRRGGASDPAKRLEGGHTLNLHDQVVGWRWPTASASASKGSGPTLLRKDGKMRGDRLDHAYPVFTHDR